MTYIPCLQLDYTDRIQQGVGLVPHSLLDNTPQRNTLLAGLLVILLVSNRKQAIILFLTGDHVCEFATVVPQGSLERMTDGHTNLHGMVCADLYVEMQNLKQFLEFKQNCHALHFCAEVSD